MRPAIWGGVSLLLCLLGTSIYASEHGYYHVVHANDSRLTADSQQPPKSSAKAFNPSVTVRGQSGPSFELEFEDQTGRTGSGFDHPSHGPALRSVVTAAFSTMGELLSSETGTARILIKSQSPYFQSNTLAIGIPYFECSNGFQKPVIFNALRHDQHLGEIDGEMHVNLSLPVNRSMKKPAPDRFDLYTGVLHEITHILGFIGFDVDTSGQPLDCGGAKMLPEIARHMTDITSRPLWSLQQGQIRYTGKPDALKQPVFFAHGQDLIRLVANPTHINGHWHEDSFQDRRQIMMLDNLLKKGEMRRNISPETKTLLSTVMGYHLSNSMPGLSGTWYDPSTAGRGFILHFHQPDAFIIYFFGFQDNTERLWMIGVGKMQAYGQEIQMELNEVTGGTFNNFNSGNTVEKPWGTLELTFTDCQSAEARLTGIDGQESLTLKRLAATSGINCF